MQFNKDFLQNIFSSASNLKDCDRIWTDTRSIQAKDLFVAIPGEKFDGHEFVLEASKKGAAGAIISNPKFPDRDSLPKDFFFIEVADTTEAIRKIAKAHRERLSIPIF